VAAVSVVLVGMAISQFWIADAHLADLAAYLAVWVPLGASVLVASFWHGTRSLVRDVGLRFRPLDALWGLSVGLLARVAASIVEISIYGRMGSGGVTLDEPLHDAWWLFGALLAPVLIAPFIEEVFFRGLLLRAVSGVTVSNGGGRMLSAGIAVTVSALVFAALHVLVVGGGSGNSYLAAVLVVGLSTLVFGLAAGILAVTTGRIGGAIIAHVTFNALVVVPAVF
jgi:membrane protease YdiL (CAAX protease family)